MTSPHAKAANPKVLLIERKGEGGEEVTSPESEYLPAGAHRAPFARRGETLIAKMKGESPDPRIPCGSFWLTPERKFMPITPAGTAGVRIILLLFFFPLFLPPVHAAGLLLGSGDHRNHLLILFAPGQTLQYELRHDGRIQTGAQLMTAVIQATGGLSVTTPAQDSEGNPIPFSTTLTAWGGQGLFAHFYDYGWGIFANGFAAETFMAAADGSWSSYFAYQVGGPRADFTSALVGATDRILAEGDHDAYVLSSTFSSPGLAAWMVAHDITDLTADSDSDGMDNLFEYALRQNPRNAESVRPIQMGHLQTNGGTFLTLTYRRPHDGWAVAPAGADAGYDGIGYTVETSDDLANWESGMNHLTQTVTPDAVGAMATVVARVPADSPKRFLRLRIHRP